MNIILKLNYMDLLYYSEVNAHITYSYIYIQHLNITDNYIIYTIFITIRLQSFACVCACTCVDLHVWGVSVCLCVSVYRQSCSDNYKGKSDFFDRLLQLGILFIIELISKVKAKNFNSWFKLASVLSHGYLPVVSEGTCSPSNSQGPRKLDQFKWKT